MLLFDGVERLICSTLLIYTYLRKLAPFGNQPYLSGIVSRTTQPERTIAPVFTHKLIISVNNRIVAKQNQGYVAKLLIRVGRHDVGQCAPVDFLPHGSGLFPSR